MVDLAEARTTAAEYIQNLSASMQTGLVLVDDHTRDEDWCWVFFYDSRAHLESGEDRDMLVGTGPLVVVRATGTLHTFGSSTSVDEALDEVRPAADVARPAPIPRGLTRVARVNRGEFGPLVEHLELPPPAPLSPLPDLLSPPGGAGRGPARKPDEILQDFRELPESTVHRSFTPLAVPDRVVDARSGLFNAPLSPCRLYSSRRVGELFAGLRPSLDHDYEVLTPYAEDDLAEWVQGQLQFSAGASVPPPEGEADAEQLAFLLALVDAFKTGYARSYARRQPEPMPITLSATDVLDAQSAAALVADRRWLTRAVGELFALLIHPGGRTGVALPAVTPEFVELELRRYVEAGYLERVGGAGTPRYEPSLALTSFAAQICAWTSMLSLHDIQLVGWEDGRPVGQEELLIFVVTQSVLLALLSQGLTRSPGNWDGVRFGLRALSLAEASMVTRDFLLPIPEVTLPDEVYAPAVHAPATATSAAATAPPPPPTPQGKEFTPTHLVPQGGMPAWAAPDPTLEPVARIDARVELQLLERAGDWAHIVCSNGWSAWVDSRAMEEIRN
ncbi:YrhB domain-containing protein [Streptomyces collinus]|uniref:YrhB domain-containing protein n=1 Tax=Streptomyces collinus TaxID=42684 RepID=UPI002941C3B1|nr:YrhB domain-containing protein [Streptomyces collinus]